MIYMQPLWGAAYIGMIKCSLILNCLSYEFDYFRSFE